jgi:hypothetical protein
MYGTRNELPVKTRIDAVQIITICSAGTGTRP